MVNGIILWSIPFIVIKNSWWKLKQILFLKNWKIYWFFRFTSPNPDANSVEEVEMLSNGDLFQTLPSIVSSYIIRDRYNVVSRPPQHTLLVSFSCVWRWNKKVSKKKKMEKLFRETETEKHSVAIHQRYSKSITFLVLSFVPILLFFGVVTAIQYKAQKNFAEEVSLFLSSFDIGVVHKWRHSLMGMGIKNFVAIVLNPWS